MKKIVLIVLSIIFSTALMAQEVEMSTKKESFFKLSNITYGGNFGFHLDKYEFNMLLMPEIGYKLFPRWKVSVAPLYSYYGYVNSYYGDGEHTLGVRVGTTIDLLNSNHFPKFNVFVYAGYQYEHHWEGDGYYSEYDANYVDVGFGIKYRVHQRANAYLLVSWHAFVDGHSKFDDANWFPDPIPSISFGVEIN